MPFRMAHLGRDAYYDRNMNALVQQWTGTVGAHASTIRWTYTCPPERRAMVTLVFLRNFGSIQTDGKRTQVWVQLNGNAVVFLVHTSTTELETTQTWTAIFYLNAGDVLQGKSFSDDTIDHYLEIATCLIEFDE